MSIGWIMFWKAVVVAVWIVIVERWVAFRRRRQQEGLPMRYSKRSDSYVVHDWTDWVNTAFRWGKYAFFAFALAIWTTLSIAFLFWGRDGQRWWAETFFSLVS